MDPSFSPYTPPLSEAKNLGSKKVFLKNHKKNN
jgi:hypothetical protein